MSKLQFYLSLLRFSMMNPNKGLKILESFNQVRVDQQNKQQIHNYDNVQHNTKEVIDLLFPESNYIQNEFKKNISILQNHLSEFSSNLDNKIFPSKEKPYPLVYQLDNESGFFLYTLCKILKPEIVVETGVAYGLSSSYVLQALKENNKGTLYSIDSTFRPWESEKMIGSAIPSELKNRWKFINGVATDKLKDLLKSLQQIDIFIHDSLHTYTNMMSEFNIAWPFVKNNGFLISDDVGTNNAFYDFCIKNSLESIILSQKNQKKSYLGIIKKTKF